MVKLGLFFSFYVPAKCTTTVKIKAGVSPRKRILVTEAPIPSFGTRCRRLEIPSEVATMYPPTRESSKVFRLSLFTWTCAESEGQEAVVPLCPKHTGGKTR